MGTKNKNVEPGSILVRQQAPATGSVGTNEEVGVLRLNEVNNLGTIRDSIDALPDQGRVYAGKDVNGVTINLRSLTAGNGIHIEETPTTIKIGVSSNISGVITGARSTDTTGVAVYKDPPVNGDLVFRRIQAGTGINVTPTPDSLGVVIAMSNPDAYGDINGAVNLGLSPSLGLYVNKASGKLNFRNLSSASGKITLALGSQGRQIDLDINEALINIANTSGVLPVARVSGLAAVATSGSYVDLLNKPTIYSRLQDLLDYTGTPSDNQLLRFTAGKWSPFTFVQQNAFAKLTVGANSIVASVPSHELRLDSSTITLAATPGTSTVGINLTPSGAIPGTYVNSGVTVDTYGRITAITNGTPSYVDPLTTVGDLLHRNASNVTTRLPIGTVGQVLASSGTQPVWQSVPPSVASLAWGKGTGITIVGTGTTGAITATATLDNTTVAAGNYTAATITVDAQGRITNAVSTTPFSGTRKVATGTGLTGGGDLTQDLTLSLTNTAVVPGSYVAASITVDAQGRITNATATPVVLSTRKVLAGTALTGGGDLTADVTLSLANTTVAAGSYSAATITVDAQGRITAASSTNVVPAARKILTNAGITGGGDLTADRTLGLELILSAAQAGLANYPSAITVDRYGRVTDVQSGGQPLTADFYSSRGDLVYGTGDDSSFGVLSLNDTDVGKFIQAASDGTLSWSFVDGPALGMVSSGDLVVGDFTTTANAATKRRVLPIGTAGQLLKVGMDSFPRWESNPSFVSLPGDPNTTQLPAGTYNVFKNTTTGRIATWVNDAGVLRSSTIYAP